MSNTTRTLEARIEELERKVEALTEHCAELKDRLRLMAVAKVSEPRFPFFNWQLFHGSSLEDQGKMFCVLTALDDRVTGRDTPPEFRKEIEGVPNEVLYGDQPLTVEDAANAIKTITGLVHDGALFDLVEAIHGQGMVRNLCPFLLDGLRAAGVTPSSEEIDGEDA